jgi:hypothetical protein
MPSRWTCSVTLFDRVEIFYLLVCLPTIAANSSRHALLFDPPPSFYARQAGSNISSRDVSSAFKRARTPSGSVSIGRGV